VLTTEDLKIQITRSKVIRVGQKGNEYGEKPVIAFWYTTTNLSGGDVDLEVRKTPHDGRRQGPGRRLTHQRSDEHQPDCRAESR
jgi:hypothetical protein